MTSISGNANDLLGATHNHPSGISANGVSVAIQQVGGNWWDGSGFNGSNPLYSTATYIGTTAGTWSYALPVVLQNALTSSKQYLIVSRSTDIAGNAEFGAAAANIPVGTGITVTYDTAAPTATIVMPLNNLPGINSLLVASGTATDDVGVSTVKIAIQKQSNGFWYGGSSFNQSSADFLAVTTLSPNATYWTYSPSGNLLSKLTDNNRYIILVQAQDLAGNIQTIFNAGISSVTITVDETNPSAIITPVPVNGGSYQPANIGESASGTSFHGTNTDPNPLHSGVQQTQLELVLSFRRNHILLGWNQLLIGHSQLGQRLAGRGHPLELQHRYQLAERRQPFHDLKSARHR